VFATELKDCDVELGRLETAKRIPDGFLEIKETVHTNAFGVLEATLNLVGQQLTYFATNGGKLGSSQLRLTDARTRC
jgi:hypothetical protein